MWISSVLSWLQGAGKSPLRGRRPKRTFRPGVEVLEGRAVPAILVTNLNDAGPGSLRQAIADANADPTSGDTIVFPPGFTGSIILTTGQLTVRGPVTILGPGAGLLDIDSNGEFRIFQFDNASTSLSHYDLSGVTLLGGHAETGDDLFGGGIAVASETLFLRDVVISHNRAQGVGGGIFVGTDGMMLMENCTVVGNQSGGSGAGLFFADGSAGFIRNCTISGNQTVGGGSTGGGIFYGRGTGLAIESSTISGNTATESGGGIRVFGGPVRITSSTIAFNTAATRGGGGGISVHDGIPPVALESTIVAGNAVGTTGTGPDISGEVIADFCLVGNTTGMVLDSGSNNVTNVDPRLAPLADNGGPTHTHALLPGSPALNAGTNRAALPTDQRGPGFFRTAGPRPDIGAFEVQSLPPPGPGSPLGTFQVVEILLKRVKGRTRVGVVVDGVHRHRFFPFGAFTGRVQVQKVDVNGDGLLDVIARATVNGKKRTRTFLT
jgi:hypothetical protein